MPIVINCPAKLDSPFGTNRVNQVFTAIYGDKPGVVSIERSR